MDIMLHRGSKPIYMLTFFLEVFSCPDNDNEDKQGKLGLLSLWTVGRLSFAIRIQSSLSVNKVKTSPKEKVRKLSLLFTSFAIISLLWIPSQNYYDNQITSFLYHLKTFHNFTFIYIFLIFFISFIFFIFFIFINIFFISFIFFIFVIIFYIFFIFFILFVISLTRVTSVKSMLSISQ